jgi:hypothetical protein
VALRNLNQRLMVENSRLLQLLGRPSRMSARSCPPRQPPGLPGSMDHERRILRRGLSRPGQARTCVAGPHRLSVGAGRSGGFLGIVLGIYWACMASLAL